MASSLGGPLLFAVPTAGQPINVFGYGALDSGATTATAINDLASLSGVPPSDVAITFGDLERVSTTFSPSGCAPVPFSPASNCDQAISGYGDSDGAPPFLNISLAGTGPILTADLLSVTVTTDSDISSPGFATATGSALVRFMGGVDPYLAEVLGLSGGTGLAEIELPSFNAACIPGTDPCSFGISGTLTIIPEPSAALLVGLGLIGLVSKRPRLTA